MHQILTGIEHAAENDFVKRRGLAVIPVAEGASPAGHVLVHGVHRPSQVQRRPGEQALSPWPPPPPLGLGLELALGITVEVLLLFPSGTPLALMEVVVSVEALTVLGMFPILLPAPGVVPVEGLAGPVPVLGTPLSWDRPSPLAALPPAGTPGPAAELEATGP